MSSSSNSIAPGSLSIEGLPKDGCEWFVQWYLGIVRNPPALSEPAVRVLLKARQESSKPPRTADIGITHVGQVRLGSIWKDGTRVKRRLTDYLTFNVSGSNFSPDSAICVRKLARIAENTIPGTLLEKMTALRVPCSAGNINTLIIPTIELFSRTYGRSQYVKRVLAALPFDDAKSELLHPDQVTQDPGYWLVTVAKACFDEDALFLAHLKHDPTTFQRVRDLCGSLQSTASSVPGQREAVVAPSVFPWWSDNVQLRCRGVSLRFEPGTFLVLRIDGMSHPAGPPLQLDRENTNRTSDDATTTEDHSSSRIVHVGPSTSVIPTTLVHTKEPSGAQMTYTIDDDEFVTLGTPREVKKVERASPRRSNQLVEAKPEPITNEVSGGNAHGGKHGPVPGSIGAPTTYDDTVVRKVWKALLAIQSERPGVKLEQWTGTGFCPLADPIGVPLVVPSGPSISKLYHVGRGKRRRARRYCLARITVGSKVVYVFEIERRIRAREGNVSESEKFRGLVVKAGNSSVAEVVQQFVDHIEGKRRGATSSKGDVATSDDFPTSRKVHSYNHCLDDGDKTLTRAVRNALTKVDLLP